MLSIRFYRVGKKNNPFFKIIINDKRKSAKSGMFLEELGYYNPIKKEKSLNKDRILHWLKLGAQPSDTVKNLLISAKIIEGKKIAVHKKKKAGQDEEKK